VAGEEYRGGGVGEEKRWGYSFEKI